MNLKLKNKLLLTAITCLPVMAAAQVSLGVKAGANFSKWRYEKTSNEKQLPSAGIAVAIPIEIMFGDILGLQLEPGFTQKTNMIKSSITNDPAKVHVVLNYVEIPVMLKLVMGQNFKVCISAGGFAAVAASGKTKWINPDFGTYKWDFKNSSNNRFEAGLAAGVGIKIPVSRFFFTVDSRYEYAITSLVKKPYDPIHTQGISLMAGVLFPLRRS